MPGNIVVVSIGPGSLEQLTPAARVAIEQSECLIGYETYLRLIADLAPTVPRESSGMHQEVERATRAVELALEGRRVTLVCGGDAGIYALAGLVLEVVRLRSGTVPVTVLPGVSALNAAAALLGAPLVSDFAVVSLSDYLVPLPVILERLEAAARADFVICLYNPKGRRRAAPFIAACELMGRYRGPETPVGIVRDAYRAEQRIVITTLRCLADADVDMRTTVIVGNSQTFVYGQRMVTPRGYDRQYDLVGDDRGEAAPRRMASATDIGERGPYRPRPQQGV